MACTTHSAQARRPSHLPGSMLLWQRLRQESTMDDAPGRSRSPPGQSDSLLEVRPETPGFDGRAQSARLSCLPGEVAAVVTTSLASAADESAGRGCASALETRSVGSPSFAGFPAGPLDDDQRNQRLRRSQASVRRCELQPLLLARTTDLESGFPAAHRKARAGLAGQRVLARTDRSASAHVRAKHVR